MGGEQINRRFPPSATDARASLAPPEPSSARTDGATPPLSHRQGRGMLALPGRVFWGAASGRTAFGRRGSLAVLPAASRAGARGQPGAARGSAALPPSFLPVPRERAPIGGSRAAAPHSRGAAASPGGRRGGARGPQGLFHFKVGPGPLQDAPLANIIFIFSSMESPYNLQRRDKAGGCNEKKNLKSSSPPLYCAAPWAAEQNPESQLLPTYVSSR